MEPCCNLHHRFRVMLTAPATNRRRTEYLWARAINDRRILPNYAMSERPNTGILRSLLEMNRDHPAIGDNMARLESYLRVAREHGGHLNTYYQQKELTAYAVPGYGGSVRFGRAYPLATAAFLPTPVVSTLWKETHMEVDLVNAYPTMLVSCFRDLDLPTLKAYVRDPSAVVNHFSRTHGIGRKELKKMLLAVICSYGNIPDDFGLGVAAEEKARALAESDFYRGLMVDLNRIAGHMGAHYRGLLDTVHAKCAAERKDQDRVMGVALSYLCADMEHVVMRCVLDKLKEMDPTVLDDCIWKFDGVIVKRGVVNFPECAGVLRDHVLEKTGVPVSLNIRALEGAIALSVSEEELRAMNEYDAWKVKFEKEYHVSQRPACYCRVWPDGSLQELNVSEFQLQTQTEPMEMMKRWKVDPERLVYKGRDFAPPPFVIADGYYNLWNGFYASKLPVPEEPVDLSIYLRHVRLLMGGEGPEHAAAAEYMHKLLAYKFQRPGDLWRVMVFIRSPQGVGKDIWLDFLFSLMGKQYGTRLTKVGEIAGLYNSAIEGKLLVGFSEMEAKDCNENMEVLKDMITSTRLIIKKKYVASYETNNSACFIGFSNNYNAIKISPDDRRVFSVTASGLYANKPEYYQPLLDFFKKPESKRAVYDYYMGLDVSDFDPSGHRVVTETMENMREDALPTGELFLKQYFHQWIRQAQGDYDQNVRLTDNEKTLRIPQKTVHEHFLVLAGELNFKGVESKRKMAMLCKRLLTEASSRFESVFKVVPGISKPIFEVVVRGTKMYKFDVASVSKYIVTNLGGSEGPDGEAVDFLRQFFVEPGQDVEMQDVNQQQQDEPVVANPLAMAIEIPNFNDAVAYETRRGAYAAGFVPGN